MGDVIGFPALASTSAEQGRLAACHAFAAGKESAPEYFPLGIYAVPEISIVGKTEQQLREAVAPEGAPTAGGNPVSWRPYSARPGSRRCASSNACSRACWP